MLSILRYWSLVLLAVFASITAVTQDSIEADVSLNTTLPSLVKMIGDDESMQTVLNTECADILVQIDGMNMSKAYTVWLSMLSDLEQHAVNINYDIKGFKLWLNVYWNPDGSIRQIIFYPKPNSRNVDFNHFIDFMNTYAQTYVLPVAHTACFSHFGSASFPTFYDHLLKKE